MEDMHTCRLYVDPTFGDEVNQHPSLLMQLVDVRQWIVEQRVCVKDALSVDFCLVRASHLRTMLRAVGMASVQTWGQFRSPHCNTEQHSHRV